MTYRPPPAGMLDERFQLSRPVETSSPTGAVVTVYRDEGPRYGRLAVEGGGEGEAPDRRIRARTRARICIRPHDTLDESWRLTRAGTTWSIDRIQLHEADLMTLHVVAGEEA